MFHHVAHICQSKGVSFSASKHKHHLCQDEYQNRDDVVGYGKYEILYVFMKF